MGLGAAADDQAPVEIGSAAQSSPILSTASLIASAIMLKMAGVPKNERLNEMVKRLDGVEPGLGAGARSNFLERAARSPANKVDQSMFDAIRAAIADVLVKRTLASVHGGTSGLGQTIAEAQGRTSQGVNDANAIFCTYITGTAAIVGGVMDQTATGTGTGALTGSAGRAAATGGCGAGMAVINGQNAQAMARITQSGAAQTLAMQAESDARFMRYALVGGGLLGIIGLGYVLVKKS
jgi:hypothetical protein